ncbi:maturase [Alicyclobacillus tolerans]|uniref:reverse transcriptase domain-containing protein n=1 Tax=Alicyclobacillus tolerans TaxID=90970 RepID=UPI001EFF2FA9|nr:reverse transcriptase domain-containing protein [Alicyclobacillus tolerans]MCF8568596.1 maturase [Alicyclobacillus tolerans]
MQNAETVLGVIQDLGKRGLPLKRLYRNLFNPFLYLRAYGRIYRNHGALTPGTTPETADGMSLEKIQTIIKAVRYERYRWLPVRRTYIAKKNSSKKRPLGLPSWSDKLLQEVIRSLLEAYYEPQFSPKSHGFRPGRGCHTALDMIHSGWRGTTWFIEGDISQCFDRLDHTFLLSTLAEKIQDQRFLRLVKGLLEAGYLEEWRYYATLSGAPQGGVSSPILSNIYLDKLDKFVETQILPKYNAGIRRTPNREYMRVHQRISYYEKKGNKPKVQQLRKLLQSLPSRDPKDPEFRRLRYVRYADDWLLGFCGPKCEAEDIKRQIGEFLHSSLKLELSEEKTLITNARTEAAHFLGYEIVVLNNDHKHDQRGHRSINGQIGLKVPMKVIREKCKPYLCHGKPTRRTERIVNTDYSIVAQFQSEFRGIAEYYQLAFNRHRLSRLKYVMEQSLTKTLACKYRISVNQVYRRYRTILQTEQGPRNGLQVTIERGEGRKPLVAQWGGISLARRTMEVELNDSPPPIWNSQRSELLQRLLADTCELCDSNDNIEVHHIRHLKDLKGKGNREQPEWVKNMAARKRKTLIVCRKCHEDIHAGRR